MEDQSAPIPEKRGRGLGGKRRERPGAHLLGVIAMFGRRPLSEEEFERFAVFAKRSRHCHQKRALFTEVEQIKNRLPVESLYLEDPVAKSVEQNTCRL